MRRKGTDARWTQQSGVSYFGYKDNVFADEEYKFIRDYAVTDASLLDSVAYLSVLQERVAYTDQEALVIRRMWGRRRSRSYCVVVTCR